MTTLNIFANFFIDTPERFLRMKDSFVSFEDVRANKWVINIRGRFADQAGRFLKEKLGENHKFYEFLEGEWNELKSDNSYDPLAVCAYFRIEIEKRIYEKLAECKKEGFLTVHKTLKKIEYASENSVDIGDIWPLLAPIFNQALHADDVRKAQNIKRKLNNTIIKKVMKKAMDTEF